MRYLWRTVRTADQEGLRLPPHIQELCESFGRTGGYQLYAHAYIESVVYPRPKTVATLVLVFDEDGEAIDETGLLYLRENDIDLQGFYSALSEASDLPPALLSWLLDSEPKAVRIGKSPLYQMAVYGFTSGGENQWQRFDVAPLFLETDETNIVLGAAEEKKGKESPTH